MVIGLLVLAVHDARAREQAAITSETDTITQEPDIVTSEPIAQALSHGMSPEAELCLKQY